MSRIVTLTHYTYGECPRAPRPQHLPLETALADMFARLRAGAMAEPSGFIYGLTTLHGPENQPTGSDKAFYGNLPRNCEAFIIEASKWWLRDEEMVFGSPEHDLFIRRTLLVKTGHELSDEELATAMVMSEEDFLAIMAMAIESGESAAEFFRGAVTTS